MSIIYLPLRDASFLYAFGLGKGNKEGVSRGEKRRVPKSRTKIGGKYGGGEDESSNTVDGEYGYI